MTDCFQWNKIICNQVVQSAVTGVMRSLKHFILYSRDYIERMLLWQISGKEQFSYKPYFKRTRVLHWRLYKLIWILLKIHKISCDYFRTTFLGNFYSGTKLLAHLGFMLQRHYYISFTIHQLLKLFSFFAFSIADLQENISQQQCVD